MPRKATVKKTRRPSAIKNVVPEAQALGLVSAGSQIDYKKFFSTKYFISFAVILLLALLLWRNKSLLVVATVNGQPVPRWNLENRMTSRYGAQTLDEIVNEELIRQAGRQKGVSVKASDIDAKIAEVEKSLNGKITLSDALAQQGMTMSEFRGQVELQLIMDQLVGNSVTVSNKEITDYIASNSASLTSTDPASQSAEVKNILLSQKKNVAYRQLFNDLKAKAKISKFL